MAGIAMSPREVLALLKWLDWVERRDGMDDERSTAMAAAWWEQLPGDLVASDAKRLCMRLMRHGERINAATLRLAYEAAVTPAHRQGIDSAATPSEPLVPALQRPVEGQEGGIQAIAPRSGTRTRVDALSVSCPYCGAFERVACSAAGKALTMPHPSRYEAAGLRDPSADRLKKVGQDREHVSQ